jgi:hypothetical protein
MFRPAPARKGQFVDLTRDLQRFLARCYDGSITCMSRAEEIARGKQEEGEFRTDTSWPMKIAIPMSRGDDSPGSGAAADAGCGAGEVEDARLPRTHPPASAARRRSLHCFRAPLPSRSHEDGVAQLLHRLGQP